MITKRDDRKHRVSAEPERVVLIFNYIAPMQSGDHRQFDPNHGDRSWKFGDLCQYKIAKRELGLPFWGLFQDVKRLEAVDSVACNGARTERRVARACE